MTRAYESIFKAQYNIESSEEMPGASQKGKDVSKMDIDSPAMPEAPASEHVHITNGRNENESEKQTPALDTGSGIAALGSKVKELVQAVRALRSLGVEDLNLPLPKIVVVGDQSTGKSSLVEAISEIRVPRAAGTCTRCPLEINLRESPQWTCQVSLVNKYLYEGSAGEHPLPSKALRAEAAAGDRPFGPWQSKDLDIFHFATVTSEKQVPKILERAQLAILNPGTDYRMYWTDNEVVSEATQAKFSPNVIRLDLSGPTMPDLSFYDLPGIINTTGVPEEQYLVNLVKNLAKSYIKSDYCINLLTIPMTDDPANSSASQLIREMKAGPRTLGCFTKPDRLQVGESYEQWTQILKEERFRLGHGYFVIKNNPDVTVDHAAARAQEHDYFQSTEPWAGSLASFKDRLGTHLLRNKLSELLTLQIQNVLPKFIEQVHAKMNDVEVMLDGLPPATTKNASGQIMGEMMKFQNQLEKEFDGGSNQMLFRTTWGKYCQNFRAALENATPVLQLPAGPMEDDSSVSPPPVTPKRSGNSSSNVPTPVIDVSSEEDEPLSKPGSRKRSTQMDHSPTPKAPRRAFKLASDGDNLLTKCNIKGKTFQLEEVRLHISNAYSGGIPKQAHPHATENMIKLSMAHWNQPLDHFLRATGYLCNNRIVAVLRQVFGHREQTMWWDRVSEISKKFADDVYTQYGSFSHQLLSCERTYPKTLDEKRMEDAKNTALEILRARRRAAAQNHEQVTPSGKSNKSTGRTNKVQETDHKPDPFEVELETMSTVQGYYLCAYSRFVDTICITMEQQIFAKCRDELQNAVARGIGLMDEGADARLSILLSTHPVHEVRRAELNKEKAMLAKAQETLERISQN